MKGLAIAQLLFTGRLAVAKDKDLYNMTITVLSTKNVESKYESGSSSASVFGAGGALDGGARSSYGHAVAKHVFAISSDGNSYDLVPEDSRDFLAPGKYPAYLTKPGYDSRRSKDMP